MHGRLALCEVAGQDDTGSAGPIRKLHEAERALGIAPVKGRGYHGIKRAHVGASWETAGGDAAKVGDLTGNSSPDVPRRHYRKAKSSKVAKHMRQVRARFGGRRNE